MSMLGKLFSKKKKELIPSTELKVCIVDDTSNDLSDTFGITDKRREELIKITDNALRSEENISECCKIIVDQCKHVNEVIVCIIFMERLNNKSSYLLNDMLAQMFKR